MGGLRSAREGGLRGGVPGRECGGRCRAHPRSGLGGGASSSGFVVPGRGVAVPLRPHGVRIAAGRVLLVGESRSGTAVCGAPGPQRPAQGAGAVAFGAGYPQEGNAMKRLPMLLLAAAASLPAVAGAQGLTMQMSNGWKFTFSGNVNAFAVYSSDANGGRKNFNIRTGLLPGFAVFDAKGKEEGLDLGIHVGFAPEIQNNGQVHDGLAQIYMRQLYLTVGMKSGWQILVGREL